MNVNCRMWSLINEAFLRTMFRGVSKVVSGNEGKYVKRPENEGLSVR